MEEGNISNNRNASTTTADSSTQNAAQLKHTASVKGKLRGLMSSGAQGEGGEEKQAAGRHGRSLCVGATVGVGVLGVHGPGPGRGQRTSWPSSRVRNSPSVRSQWSISPKVPKASL